MITLHGTLLQNPSMNWMFPILRLYFFYAEFAKDIASRHSYYCNIVTIYNVAVLFKIKNTSSIMLHTTDSELKGGSSGVRQLLPIRQLFAFNGYQLPSPSQSYTDNAAVHAIVESNRMTPRCKHYDIPIAFLHQEHNSSYRLQLIRTMIMLADMGTKANTPKYHKQFKYWASGARFLPPLSSQHANHFQMKYYEMNFGKIISSCDWNGKLVFVKNIFIFFWRWGEIVTLSS